MISLNELRQKYPQYSGRSDEELADGLYRKFYSGKMALSDFRQKLGLARKEYAASEVPGAAAENLLGSAKRVKKAFGEAAEHPLQTGAEILKSVIPGASAPASPLGESMAQDWGFREPTWRGTWEQAKRNVAERPIESAADVSMIAAPLGGPVGSVARGMNVPYQAGRLAMSPFLPRRYRPGFRDARNALRQEGVEQTAGQATGRKTLKYAESEIGGAGVQNILDRQAEQFTRAASRRIGEDSPHLDAETRNRARNRIGGEMNAIGLRNNIPHDPQLATDLTNAVNMYVQSVPIPAPGIANLAAAISSRPNIPGRVYNGFRSRLSRLQRNTKDPQLIAAYQDIREALDDAMERSLVAAGNQADIAALANARRQYRNLMVLDNAMATGAGNIARGLLTPEKLEEAAASGPNRSWYSRGVSDFSELAKAGRVGMSAMPESGTGARTAIRAGFGIGGGLLVGGGGLSPEAAAGVAAGVAAPAAAGAALMSRPVQAYLSTNIPGRTAMGRTAATATAAIPRVESLKHLENVVSAPVMDDIKQNPETRKALNEWLKARNSRNDVDGATRRLAEAIALRVKRPDLVERIISELSEARGP